MKNKNLTITERYNLLKYIGFNEISLNRLYNKNKINKKEYEYIMSKKKELEENNKNVENEINYLDVDKILSTIDNDNNNKVSKLKNKPSKSSKSINKQNKIIDYGFEWPKKALTIEELQSKLRILIESEYRLKYHLQSEFSKLNIAKEDMTEELTNYLDKITTINNIVR